MVTQLATFVFLYPV